MNKIAVFACLGDYYQSSVNGFEPLPFVYNNIDQFSGVLKNFGWIVTLPLKDKGAAKNAIITKLTEVINNCAPDDWVLFYFAGHASKYPPQNTTTFCVTYDPSMTNAFWPPVSEFFSDSDYQQVVTLFEDKAPMGHLIAVFDCCYADGLLNDFDVTKPFQTVIAASAKNFPAYYDQTSYFFQVYSRTWSLPFGQLQANMDQLATSLRLDLQSVIHPAENFKSKTL